MNSKDLTIIRDLAKQIAEIAALPIQEEKRRLWRGLNSKKPERPMVMINQVCWHEMNADGDLTLLCEDEEARGWERQFRTKLYEWKHFPVDSVVDNYLPVYKVIGGGWLETRAQEENLSLDAANDVVSHKFENQFKTFDDLEKIKFGEVYYNEAETKKQYAHMEELFGGIIDLRLEGGYTHANMTFWDPITSLMGVDGILDTIIDDPDLMHAIVRKFVDGFMTAIDKMEALNLFCGPQSTVHCTGAWNDELPQTAAKPDEKRTAKDLWMFTMAQSLSTVSPAMFNEYEIEYAIPICERFGLVYYGCCEPLHDRINYVRRLPNVRKVSMSPWADKTRGAEALGKDYVYSCKPNPAFLATSSFDEDLIKRDLLETKKLCEKFGCPLEIILKDLSTISYKPERLSRWAEIAMDVVQG